MASPPRTAAFIAWLVLAIAFPAHADPGDAAPFATMDEKAAWYHGLLTDEDPEARLQAALWLGEHHDGAGERILIEEFRRQRQAEEAGLFTRLRQCLCTLRCRAIVPDLIEELEGSPRDEAVTALADIADDRSRDALARLARGITPIPPAPEPDPDSLESQFGIIIPHPDPEAVRLRAALALVAMGETSFAVQVEQALTAGSSASDVVIGYLAGMDPAPRTWTSPGELHLDALGIAPLACFRARLGIDGASPESVLREALAAGNPDEALALAALFAQAGDAEARKLCLAEIDSASALRRSLAAFTLGRIGETADFGRLITLLHDDCPIRVDPSRNHDETISDVVVRSLAVRGAESAGILRELLTRPDEGDWILAAGIAAGAPGHGLSRELLSAARDAHGEETRKCLIDACAEESPETLKECVPLLADLLKEHDAQAYEVVDLLKRTASLEATRVIVARLAELGHDDFRMVEALGKLGHEEGLAAIEAYANGEESRDRALHAAAPDRHPPSLGQLREEALAHAAAWDYEGMMSIYDRVADFLVHRWHTDQGVAVPRECTIRTRTYSERSFLRPQGTAEIVKLGGWIDVVWNNRKLGTLTKSQFTRLWRIATTLMQSVEACAAAAGLTHRRQFIGAHVVRHVDVAIPVSAGETAWTWRIDSESGQFDPKIGDLDQLVDAFWELLEGQRARCKQIATEGQQKMLQIRGDARDRYLLRCRADWAEPPMSWIPRAQREPDPAPFVSPPFAESLAADLSQGADDSDPWHRLAIVLSLMNADEDEARAGLKAAARDPFFLVREGAAWMDFCRRSQAPPREGTDPELECVLAARNWAAREAAARAWESEPRGRAGRLRVLLQSPEPDLRMLGARLCTSMEREELRPLLQALVERDPYTIVGDGRRISRPEGGRIHPVSFAASQALKLDGR